MTIQRIALPLMALGFLCGAKDSARAQAPTNAAQPLSQPLRTPTVYRSSNGVLAVTIVAAPTRVAFGAQLIDGATYNGDYGGPVLRLHPGDTLRMHFINHLPQITNVHFMGCR